MAEMGTLNFSSQWEAHLLLFKWKLDGRDYSFKTVTSVQRSLPVLVRRPARENTETCLKQG